MALITTTWRFDDLEKWKNLASEWHGSPTLLKDPIEGAVLGFDGANDAFVIPENPLEQCDSFSISARFLPYTKGEEEQRFLHIQCSNSDDRVLLELRCTSAGWYGDVIVSFGGQMRFLNDPKLLHPYDRWATLKLVYNGTELIQLCNDKEELRAHAPKGVFKSGQTSIGRRINGISPFSGQIAWVEFAQN
jgi:hypothetical protein